MATTVRSASEADLLRTPRDGRKYELVDGEIRVSPAGSRHGEICVALVIKLGGFAKENRLGHVFDSSTGFRLPGGNVRSPDVSFVAAGRFSGAVPIGFSDVPPDLAVEVLSPDDSQRQVLDKVGEYLQAGVPFVWIVDPARERAAVYRSLTDVRHILREDTLDAEPVLPGFRCTLREILE